MAPELLRKTMDQNVRSFTKGKEKKKTFFFFLILKLLHDFEQSRALSDPNRSGSDLNEYRTDRVQNFFLN